MEEIWKPILGGGVYQISNEGRVRRGISGDIRKLYLKGDNQDKLGTNILVDGKHKSLNIAREVLKAFVRKPQGTENAYHKNGTNTDNHVDNLEWRPSGTKNTAKSVPVDVTVDGKPTMTLASSNEAATFLGRSRDTIYRNTSKGPVNGTSINKVADGPGDDAVEKPLMFGDKEVRVTDDGWVQAPGGRWRRPEVDGNYVKTTFQFDRNGRVKRDSSRKVQSENFYFHRLVCEAFHGPPPPDKGDAHHKDNNKLNNHPDNLEWVSRSYNMAESYATGTNVSANKNVTYQYKIGGEFTGEVFQSATEAAGAVGGDVGGVSMCCDGKRFSHKEFEWSKHKPAEYEVERPKMQAKARAINEEIGRKNREKKGPVKPPGKPIYAYDKDTLELKGSYASQKAAAEDTKCNKANISSCVNGKIDKTGRFIFSRLDEEAFRAERESGQEGE